MRPPARTVTGQAGGAQRVLVAISYWSGLFWPKSARNGRDGPRGAVTSSWRSSGFARCARRLALLQAESRLRGPRRREGRDRRDLRLAGGDRVDALGRAAEHPDLIHRDADHDAGRRDEEDLLALLVDDLDGRDVPRLRGDRGEDHALPATVVRREVLDLRPLAVAVLRDR